MLKRVEKIKAQMEQLYQELGKIQFECFHDNANRVPKSDTGNYDPSCNRYWYECHCLDCDKRWSEDQKQTRSMLHDVYRIY